MERNANRRVGPRPPDRGVWRVRGWRPDGGWFVIAVDRHGVIRCHCVVYDEHEEGAAWGLLEEYLERVDPAGPPVQLRLM